MNEHKDYYKILGVDKKASYDEIKKAFRRLSLETHPDKNNNDPIATNKFKEINEAWQVLQDENTRRQYDIGGIFGMNDATQINPEDLFKEIFGHGNPFGTNIFQGMAPNFDNVETHFFHVGGMPNVNIRQPITKPSPIVKKIKIPIEYAYTGCNIPIEIERWIQDGNTKIKENETLYVKIPNGIDENEMIDVDETMLVQELRRARKIMQEGKRKAAIKKRRRKQALQESQLKAVIDQEVKNVLKEMDLNLNSSWMYGKRKPRKSRHGYTHQGSFLKGLGFK